MNHTGPSYVGGFKRGRGQEIIEKRSLVKKPGIPSTLRGGSWGKRGNEIQFFRLDGGTNFAFKD